MRIAIDLMGSDTPPRKLFQGVLEAIRQLPPSFELITLVIPSIVDEFKEIVRVSSQANIFFQAASEVITMEDDPLLAIRRKKDSTLLLGMRLLGKGMVDAFVSAGNTGALIAAAKLILPAMPQIRRPALLAVLPAKGKSFVIIDAGGNIKNSSASLVQNAYLGAAYQRCFLGISLPTVGLLNIGCEPSKGSLLLKEAFRELQARSQPSISKKFLFVGNAEARDIFNGNVDVLVTDGFTGNIFLKAVEGASAFVLNDILLRLPDVKLKESLQLRFDYAEYPGALVCGVEGVVVKCHGNANEKSIYQAICQTANIVDKNLITHMREDLKAFF